MMQTIKQVYAGALSLASGPIARASIISLIIKVLAVVLGVAQAILFARILGPSGYGNLASLLSVVQILATLAPLGVASYAVRYIPVNLAKGERGKVRQFTRSAFKITCIAGLVAATSAVPAIHFLSVPLETFSLALVVVPALVCLSAIGKLSYSIVQGFGKSASALWPTQLLGPSLIVSVLTAIHLMGAALSPVEALYILLAATLCTLSVMAIILHRQLPDSSHSSVPEPTRTVLHDSVPFLWLTMGALALAELSTLMLTVLSSSDQVAFYQPIARIAALLTLPVQAIAIRFAPRVAELHTLQRHKELRAIVRLFAITTTCLVLIGGAALLIVGPTFLGFFGSEFERMVPAIAIIAATQVFCAACGPARMLLVGTGHTKEALTSDVITLAIITATGLWLIPQLGAIGAVWGLCSALVISNVIRAFQVRVLIGFWPVVTLR